MSVPRRTLNGLLLAMLLLQPPLAARAADYEQGLSPYPRQYLVVGKQLDHVRFDVPGTQAHRILIKVQGARKVVACSRRYCRSPGTQQAVVNSVRLRGPTSEIAFVSGRKLTLDPGSYVLEISATGIGTGRFSGKGRYAVTLFPSAAASPPTEDDR